MASSSSSAAAEAAGKPPVERLSLVANALKRKHSFIQFFAMTGILLLSLRSVGQKYRLKNLEEDNAALKEEQLSLNNRMDNIKTSLLAEAALEPTGAFAARLRLLFAHMIGKYKEALNVVTSVAEESEA